MKSSEHINGDLESVKFELLRTPYYAGIEKIKSLNYEIEDFIQYFPCFTGHLTLSRFLTLYELYKKVEGVPGHIAEVGVYKGASLLLFAKLVRLFESNAFTQVHGFDWFEGSFPGEMEKNMIEGGYKESYARITSLIEAQQLNDIIRLHVLDVRSELNAFSEKYPHLQFKIVFLDAGTYDNVKACLPYFWPRIAKGGILILDQYNHELAPGETIAVKEFLPDQEIYTIPNSWMPTAYIIK